MIKTKGSKFQFGSIKPSDDISALKWFDLSEIKVDSFRQNIVEEHLFLMDELLVYLEKNEIIKAL